MFKNFHNSLDSLDLIISIQFTPTCYTFLTFKTRLHHRT